MPILLGLSLIIIVFIAFSKSRDKNAKKKNAEFWQKERDSKFIPRKDISALDYIHIPYGSLPFCYFMPGPNGPVRIPVTSGAAPAPLEFTDDSGEFSVLSATPDTHRIVDELLSEIAAAETPVDNAYLRATGYSAPLAEELANAELELCKLADERILNLTGISNTELRLTYGTANLDPLTLYDQNFTALIRSLQKWGSLLASAGNKPDAVTVLSYAVSIGSDIAGTYALLARLYKEQGELSKIEELKVAAEELTTLMKPSILRDLDRITGDSL